MKALVTGGTGFIGSNIAIELINQGSEVIITGNDTEQKIPNFKGKLLQPSFVGIDWDAIGKIDVLFHEAAINDTQFMDKSEMFRANVKSSKKLFEYVIKQGCKHIVFATSTATYGNQPAPYIEGKTKQIPINPYSESKIKMEKIALKLAKEYPDVKIVGLRYCNVYGPRENHKGKRSTMIYQLAQQMLNGNPKIFKHGEQKRDYIYVKDVVKANLLAAKSEKSCILNCGSGKATTFNNIIKELNKVMGLNKQPEYIENPCGENYQSYTECDMTLAKELIGFIPEYTFEKGLQDYYNSGFLIKK
ncbi:NAD-dependent epimerase/dehydratase family protein [Candidatus Woesearchaeota archaeon]|nr:NAD-dependent epimerase/dehydratase family protein [Candidatus Woesearchaeota archaeon]